MDAEAVAKRIADAIEGDYPEMLLVAYVGSNPAEVWVEATDNGDDGTTQEFRLTVERQP